MASPAIYGRTFRRQAMPGSRLGNVLSIFVAGVFVLWWLWMMHRLGRDLLRHYNGLPPDCQIDVGRFCVLLAGEFLLALNVSTLRSGISNSPPVCGLRPMRAAR